MTYRWLFIGLILLALGAKPSEPGTPHDLFAQGLQAYNTGDFERAENLFQQLETQTTDPGQIAYHLGLVASKRGDWRQAELYFRRAISDDSISDSRYSSCLFNLGDCLARRSEGSNVKLLQQSIRTFELVAQLAPGPGLKADARYNVEVLKLLLANALAKRPNPERDPDWDDSQEPKKDPPKDKKDPGQTEKDPGPNPNKDGKKDIGFDPTKGDQKIPVAKDQEKAAPGGGNLPVLTDQDAVKELSPDDVKALLKKAEDRLNLQRQKQREERYQGERVRINDW